MDGSADLESIIITAMEIARSASYVCGNACAANMGGSAHASFKEQFIVCRTRDSVDA